MCRLKLSTMLFFKSRTFDLVLSYCCKTIQCMIRQNSVLNTYDIDFHAVVVYGQGADLFSQFLSIYCSTFKTHRIWQIRPLCPRSKWNMGEILAFLSQKWSIFEIPPCAHHVIFIKVHIFWEGHKIFAKSPPFFDWY